MRTAVAVWACAMAGLLTLTGCESTVAAARKISARGTRAFKEGSFSVSSVDRRLRVVSTAVVHDSNGTAAVVALRNTGPEPVADAPIAIEVVDPSGHAVFENNLPGAEYDLSHVPWLPPGQTVTWVNDQVLANGTAARVQARVGTGRTVRAATPRIQVASPKLVYDVDSGWEISGNVRNTSRIDQTHLVVYAIARRGGRVVSAGRAILAHLLAGKTSIFHAYLLGNPRGAQIAVSAPPSDTN